MNLPADDANLPGSLAAFLTTGRFNRGLGWVMLIAGFGAMVVVEPWIFSVRDPQVLLGSAQMQLRHAQGVLLAMALLQLVVGYVLTTKAFPLGFRLQASLCIGLGAMAYSGGYVLLFWFSLGGLLVLAGSLLNLGTFLWALRVEIGGVAAIQLRLSLFVLCLGMFLDFVSGVMSLYPDIVQLEWFGTQDEVRWRMLRLARVAGIALTVLTLLFFDLVDRTGAQGRLVKWGHRGFLVGSLTMTLTLALASFAFLEIKYLLTIPSTAVCFGAVSACVLAWRHAGRLEVLGWWIITGSLFGGMLIGMYAFDGPFPAPSGVENYQAMSRRLMRVGHASAIVFGMLVLFLAQRTLGVHWGGVANRLGVVCYLVGAALSLSTMTVATLLELPAWTLGVGPAAMFTGLLLTAVKSPGIVPSVAT